MPAPPGSSRDDWFRSDAWDEEARELFEAKLARARSSQAHYLYAKGLALTSADDDARKAAGRQLLMRVIEDYAQAEMEVAAAHYALGDSLARDGRNDIAAEHLRTCLAVEAASAAQGRRFSHFTELRLAEVLVAQDDPALFDEAWELLNAAAGNALFNSQIWRGAVARARIQAALGVMDAAARHAAIAIAALGEPEPQFPRHPGFGRIETDEATVREMERLAAS